MQDEPPSMTEFFDRVRLHLLHWPVGQLAPSAAWLMEVVDVDWQPPEDWPAEIERAITSPGTDAQAVTTQVGKDEESAILDVVARTTKGTAQVIADRHRVASLLEAWAQPAGDLHTSHNEISEGVARAAFLFVLEAHFDIEGDRIDAVEVEYEPGDEWRLSVEAGPQRYVGTVARHGRIQLSHVVDRTDL